LITKRLSTTDCDTLINRITAIMNSWLVKHLSFAGRLQLLTSVLFSLQIFWTRIFILLKRIIKILEQKFSRFLWNGKDEKAKAKVAWDRVCTPKHEGGLGIKRLADWNMVSMMNHTCTLFSILGSLWVAWIKENWLKGRSFSQISIPQNASWSWKKILKLRNLAKPFLKHKVGDERNIFLWYDNWHSAGCLLDAYGYRAVC
jgi:hypothetical protein